jgi:hypothetical protein
MAFWRKCFCNSWWMVKIINREHVCMLW